MLECISKLRLRSPALRTAGILGAGGVGFALGNLLLARVLSAEEFGIVSLLLSLVQIGAAFGSLGLPTLIVRRRLTADRQLLCTSIAVGIVPMLVVSYVALTFYRQPTTLVILLGAIILFAALGRIAGAVLQAEQRFNVSLLLTQIHNWLLLASVPVVVLLEHRSAHAVAAFILCSYLATSALAWRQAARVNREAREPLSWNMFKVEGISAAGLGLALNLMFQLDRLVIARTLPIAELATYAVVVAIAGSALRMMQVAAGYTLTPRLRAVTSRTEALGLLQREAAFVFGLAMLAGGLVLFLTPTLVHVFVGDRYEVSISLVAAILIVGFIRIWQAFSTSVVNALGSTRELLWLALTSGAATLVAIVAASWGSRYGLRGVVYGLAVGWIVTAAAASVLAARALARVGEHAGVLPGSLQEPLAQ